MFFGIEIDFCATFQTKKNHGQGNIKIKVKMFDQKGLALCMCVHVKQIVLVIVSIKSASNRLFTLLFL